MPGNDSGATPLQRQRLPLATMCYLGFVAGVVIMGFFVRWVLFRHAVAPSVPGSLTFTTAIAVPLMLAGIVALVPRRIPCCWPRRLPAPTRYACCSPACHCSCACRSGRRVLRLLHPGRRLPDPADQRLFFIEFWGQSLAGGGE
ncbi:hypothetical protein ACPA9J_18310 [Pseudomonas aeruginosa]